jgi:signal transduction histidine kinase
LQGSREAPRCGQAGFLDSSAVEQPIAAVRIAARPGGAGPSQEMRRFAAGMRTLIALLSAALLVSVERPIGLPAMGLLLAYSAGAAWVLWTEATGQPRLHPLVGYWIDVVWSVVLLQLVEHGTLMIALTLVQPVVLASIGYGVTQGLLIAFVGAAGVLLDGRLPVLPGWSGGAPNTLPAVAVLALVPAAALLSRPLSMLRHRMALVADLGSQLDPRRGLEATCATLVEALRKGCGARVAGIVLPATNGKPALLSTDEDGSFRVSEPVHRRLETLLSTMGHSPVVHRRLRWGGLLGGTRVHGDERCPPVLGAHLDELARLLDVRTVLALPLERYGLRHGHLLLGHERSRRCGHDVAALSQAAPDFFRLVEQAALVDQLQDESASHERARIGRDLHDSAIQPYLGLKYAVECVALRIPPDNPARAEVDSLAELVNGEVAALRELISGLRTGSDKGDNALVPAVRRQVKRFALLFGMDVQLDAPETLPCTRTLAGALFHMVNEAMNNVRKHTPARCIRIRLAVEAGHVVLAVTDDAGSLAGRALREFVPRSLSERAAELGGTLSVGRPNGLDTEITISIPQ